MNSIKQNIEQVITQIGLAAEKCGRDAESVQLLAVSKTKPIAAIEEAIAAGHAAFGENYVQEGVEKVQYFAQQGLASSLSWHFIGPIQSNKTRPIAEHFDWVHSVDRAKIARRLSEQRPDGMAPLNVLLQVNTSGEDSKSGLDFDDVDALADEIATMPNLVLRGLMSIPQKADDYDSQLAAFSSLAETMDKLKAKHPQLDTLSMGMSGDLDAAVAAGSTIVRIGTAIFGARDYS
ncbi:YggS family pyridoxal phosphate-dependent enzyme [Photobacterium sp. ZSDE20]|uniref:Pyridoxal phosphate homeostasis protein n=1 Tax=Photobacterium pectinilyticum TaxID=2906793 RepID=A0ABT1N0D8_9GAMM|nr:YggS family pyridoxal phosphate-dependent enzyme [Photobacterium sp. ZSDE20]MCQ1057567.1 YggS family pyridoxal phosphate-dependent enzyme [Photobacterium sp. ZSDE20]MDD1821909.1 YggS family pyridoxal phosphate-dependent enzyme [Photobacterium sp. ZSDE20]